MRPNALATRPLPADWIAEPPPKGTGLYVVRGGLSLRPRRVYVDTSVVGGCFDDGMIKASNALFAAARQGKVIILASDLLNEELEEAPPRVRAILHNMPEGSVEKAHATRREIDRLAQTYIKEGVLSQKSENDAKHIAIATVSRVDALVSWNQKHMANRDRVMRYNVINNRLGYPAVPIHKPTEELLLHGREV